MTAPTADAVRAVVAASPAAVAAHDKAAWTSLFSDDGAVHDPVGSVPQSTPAAISRFYDMFIAPNTIVFEVACDIIEGQTMIRDLTVRTTMSTGVTIVIPMHLRYTTVLDAQGCARIAGLYAHWEMASMIRQLMFAGLRGALAGTILGQRLFRTLGVTGAFGFLSGLRGVGAAGKRSATRMLRAQGLRVGKTLVAGTSVTVTVFDGARRGVAVVDFRGGEPTCHIYWAADDGDTT